jgi:hypothetical protein
MLEFREGMDPHSLDIYDGPSRIGMLQWHSGVGRFVPIRDLTYVTVNQMREIVEKHEEGRIQRAGRRS